MAMTAPVQPACCAHSYDPIHRPFEQRSHTNAMFSCPCCEERTTRTLQALQRPRRGGRRPQRQRQCNFGWAAVIAAIFLLATVTLLGNLRQQPERYGSLSSSSLLSSLESKSFRNIPQLVEGNTAAMSANKKGTTSDVVGSARDIAKQAAKDVLSHPAEFFVISRQSRQQVNYYSGVWYANREKFLKIKVSNMKTLEAATHHLIPAANEVRMARDWFDFSVEHISHWFKHFQKGPKLSASDSEEVMQKIVQTIKQYLHKDGTQYLTAENSAMRETIALLPLYDIEESGQTEVSLRLPMTTPKSANPDKERSKIVTMYSVAATIWSMHKIGIRRVVVAGRTDEQPLLVKTVFWIINDLIETSMRKGENSDNALFHPIELVFINAFNETLAATNRAGKKLVLLPQHAIQKLQFAMKGMLNPSETQVMLGNDPSYWRYVYFTEADLILHSRPSALPSFRQHLDAGDAIAAYRFQVLPHEADFPELKYPGQLVPNLGVFSDVKDLNPQNGDACCDLGDTWPGKEHGKCGAGVFWLYCGFPKNKEDGTSKKKYTNEADALEAHKRLVKYPMLRIQSGLGVVVVGSHARVCRPSKVGSCVG